MLNVFAIIALILLGIVVVVLVLLAVPVEFAFDIQNDESSRNDVALVWLFGMVRVPLRSRADKQRQKKKKTRRSGQLKAVTLLRNARFRERLLCYVRSLFRSIKIKTLDLKVRLGLDDPADTGRLWSVVGPVSALLAEIRQATIQIEPEFAEEIFSLQSHGRINLVPLRILTTSLLFFLSPSVIRALALKS